MSFVQKPIEYDANNENLGVTFNFKEGGDNSYDVLLSFNEMDDRYVIDNGREYIVYKSDVVGEPRFYELNKECRQCERHIPYNERLVCKGVHYKGKKGEFTRERDFCSEDCKSIYIEENDFTPL